MSPTAVRATPYSPKNVNANGTTGNQSLGSGVAAVCAFTGMSRSISSMEVRIASDKEIMKAPSPRSQM